MPQFYSQYGEDRWIAENMPLPARGVFVDVGAGDGVRYSNSLYFEQLGWTGLLIEAAPAVIPSLMANRCAAIEPVAISCCGELVFHECPETDYSGFLRAAIGTPRDVKIVALETLLVNHGIDKIDLLTIDTEGTEVDVLSSMDLLKHNPTIVVIEFWTAYLTHNNYDVILERLAPYYRLCHTTHCNLILRQRDSS
jgi:FkbM family methyltransferase